MNSIHVALSTLLTTVTCLAQGQLNFANRVGAGGSILNAPVTLVHSSIEGPGPDWSVQLMLVGANNSLTPLIPISTFNPAGTGAASISSMFWAPKTVTIDGHFAGEALNFKVRAWRTAAGSYDAADLNSRGQSDVFSALLGGVSQDPNTPPSTPANLLNLRSFTVGNPPEPSTITIGLLGAAVLVMFRQRS